MKKIPSIVLMLMAGLSSAAFAGPEISRLPAGPHLGLITEFDDLSNRENGVNRAARR